jgi:uncharacterized protein
MQFEWDERKRQATIIKHGIDIFDAAQILAGDHVLLDGKNDVEPRKLAIGVFDGYAVALVFVERGEKIRLITARRARRNERRAYQARYPGRNPQDEESN